MLDYTGGVVAQSVVVLAAWHSSHASTTDGGTNVTEQCPRVARCSRGARRLSRASLSNSATGHGRHRRAQGMQIGRNHLRSVDVRHVCAFQLGGILKTSARRQGGAEEGQHVAKEGRL